MTLFVSKINSVSIETISLMYFVFWVVEDESPKRSSFLVDFSSFPLESDFRSVPMQE